MERLLAIYIEALCEEQPDGSTLRDYLALLDALSVLCPFTESVRLGLFVLPIRGPSRFYGGEAAVLDMVGEMCIRDRCRTRRHGEVRHRTGGVTDRE